MLIMYKIRSFFLQYRWETGGALLLLFAVLINRFPAGHIILGGDVIQPINMAENFIRFHYDAFGGTSLFYGIFYFLDKLHISDTAQISWYLGLFLGGAYLSFLSFTALLFPRITGLARTLASLFYATNLYTLYVFTATWGYSSYQILYIFIPALTGLYLKALETKKSLWSLLFLITVFFASTSFGNPAFALAFGIYFFLLTLFLFLFRFISLDKDALKRILLLAFGACLMNAYWVLPQVPQLRTGIQEVYTSEFVDLAERLRKTSNAIFDTVRLMSTGEQNRYYPVNFPYQIIAWMEKLIVLAAFVPFFLVLYGFLRTRERREQKLYGIFFALFVVFIALVARVRFPFDSLNYFLFNLPGLNTLRGYDKFATFTPFLLSVPLLIFLNDWKKDEAEKMSRKVFALFFILIVLLALPFYAGGIQTKMSYILSNQKTKDFQRSKYSALVKVPEAYFDVLPILASDKTENKIAMLPYSPGSSVGRVNLPPWKVNGPHIAYRLYPKQYVELYDYYIPKWMFAEEFTSTEHNPEWIIDLYGLLGVKYVLYHKDAKPDSVDALEASRKYLEESGALHLANNNDSFFLYTIEDRRVFPYLYATDESVYLKLSPEGLSDAISHLRSRVMPIEYQRENQKEVIADIVNIKKGTNIFLSERYNPLWIAEYKTSQGKRVVFERDQSVKYANAWKVEEDIAGGSLNVYYSPIRLLSFGMIITGIALLLVFISAIWVARKKDNV